VKLSINENYGKLPLSFESNVGQSANAVKFLSRGNGYTMFLTATEAVFSLRQTKEKNSRAVWRLQLAGANQSATIEGQESLPGKVNYMIGNDRSQWHRGISTFRKVQYRDVWPGVEARSDGISSQLL
jgi:hypothetical protein